jgi:subtilisin family serine protease
MLSCAACSGGNDRSTSFFSRDPLVRYQWYLLNVGQDVFTGVPGTPGIDLNVMGPLSEGISGRGVNVMVVDTGTQIDHPDLKDRIDPTMLRNFDPTAPDPNDPTPPVGSVDEAHGTLVSGIVAATAGNGIGGQGVAPQATLGAARLICLDQPCGTPVNVLSTYGGIGFSQNVDVYNASYGYVTTAPIPFDLETDFRSVLLQHLETMRNGLGVLVVQAGGNQFDFAGGFPEETCENANKEHVTCLSANADPRRATPQVVTVGAVNAMGVRSSYSSGGASILVAGPGGEYGFAPGLPAGFHAAGPAMVTTDLTGCNQGISNTAAVHRFSNPFDVPGSAVNLALNPDCDYTASMNGTSSAAPAVAGVIALMLQVNPALTWRDIRQILMLTARRIDVSRVPTTVELPSGEAYVPEPAWTRNTAGHWFDNWYGFGLVDAGAAVNMARRYTAHLTGSMQLSTASAVFAPNAGAVPQGNATGLQVALPVSGSTQTVEYVQVSINMASADLSDLAVEVISPGGTRSVLQNAYNGFVNTGAPVQDWLLASNAFNGEPASGTWTVRFVDVDTRGGTPMQVASVDLRVLGH